MAAADLAAADGLAEALRWLRTHPAVIEVLGGEGRVGPYNEPPYPRLVVRAANSGGSDGDLRWMLEQWLTLEAIGDLDKTVSPATLRRILYVCLAALAELPETETEPGRAVVTHVRSLGAGGPAALPQGQDRYLSTVAVHVHPPQNLG